MYTLPDLPYNYDALGKYISADIMKLHHDKHHQTYVDKLNVALKEAGQTEPISIDELVGNLDDVPESVRTGVRNNGGGHYNHSLFWKWMSPDGGGEPSGELYDALIEKYGSYQKFVDEFTAKSLGVFGSGWAWLMPDLSIETSANQDSPLMLGEKAPLLGLDIWEHAYYLDYKNKRDDYVNAWWNVVNWDFVNQRYQDKDF